jgi:NADH dehydrogenase
MFIPFYSPGRNLLRVIVAGGGYAGLSALAVLRAQRPDAQLTLIDPRVHHLKITRLHETFRRPLSACQVPYAALAGRWGFRHIQAAVPFDLPLLGQCNAERALDLDGLMLEFDYLLIATGSPFRSLSLDRAEPVLDLGDFMAMAGADLLAERLAAQESGTRWLTVVGGGASGVQFLFEIAQFIKARRLPCRLRLVDTGAAPLTQFGPELGRYVLAKLAELDIAFHPRQRFKGQDQGQAFLENLDDGTPTGLPSDLALLFVGKSPQSCLEVNWFGQVMSGGTALERVYAAGDCSRHRPPGTNTLSAQTALRKGRLAARNILRHAGPVPLLEPYLHRDLGYVVSLGPSDAVGWLGLERCVVAGSAAALAKETAEAQYELLLAGIDTYVL